MYVSVSLCAVSQVISDFNDFCPKIIFIWPLYLTLFLFQSLQIFTPILTAGVSLEIVTQDLQGSSVYLSQF